MAYIYEEDGRLESELRTFDDMVFETQYVGGKSNFSDSECTGNVDCDDPDYEKKMAECFAEYVKCISKTGKQL